MPKNNDTRPDPLKVAVVAAGGTAAVARRYGVSNWTVQRWTREGSLPLEHARSLCAAGGMVPPEKLLAYLAEKAEERAKAADLQAAA